MKNELVYPISDDASASSRDALGVIPPGRGRAMHRRQ